MMKKKVWLVLLAVVLVSGLVIFGCGGGKDGPDGPGEGSKPFSFEGPWDGVIQAWGSNKPTISGNEVSITASTSSGFFISYADIGYEFNANDKLTITYEIDVTTPEAVITFKNSKDWEGNLAGVSDWGKGKGREYVLGNTTWSNYDGPLVKGTYNDTTKTGTIEVLQTLVKGSDAIAFQHNAWADLGGDGVEVARASVYKLKITKIENGVSGLPPEEPELTPAEQEAAFNAAVGIKALTTGDEGNAAILKIDTETGIISRDAAATGYGSWISVAIPAASLPVIASDTIKITYIAVGNAPLTPKMPDSTTDINISNKYPTFTGNGTPQTYEIPAAAYGATMPEVVSFQSRPIGDTPWSWKLKVTKIEIVHGSAIVVPLAIPGVNAPVGGLAQGPTTISTDQYTGAISWSPVNATFATGTVYTATITLTKRAGYTFTGIAANSFTVVGATTVTNPAGTSGDTIVVTVVFPAAISVPDKSITFAAVGDIKKPATSTVVLNGTTGYDVEQYVNYDQGWTCFPVKFAEGITLANYSKIDFTVITVSGAIQYKQPYVLAYAKDAVIDAYIPKTTTHVIATVSGNTLEGYGTKSITWSLIVDAEYALNEVQIVINIPQDDANKSEYTIKDIKFHN